MGTWQHCVGDEPLSDAKPVPRYQVVPQPYDQASIQRDGVELTRYHFGSALRRPFLFPVGHKSRRSLTRMGHPHDAVGHSHHNSIWITHHDVDGVNFWSDRADGKIVYKPLVRDAYHDGEDGAFIRVRHDWVNEKTGKVLMQERRVVAVHDCPSGWLIVLDLELAPAGNQVTLGKTPFGLVGVRMAKTIGVHDGGGTIRNSEGGVDEKEVFWKPARWVDYSGAITKDDRGGITLMDHPGNPNHPTHFHVRNDGWMGASLTFAGPRVIEKGRPLRLRYGLWVHDGVPQPAAINAQYKFFAEELKPQDWQAEWR